MKVPRLEGFRYERFSRYLNVGAYAITIISPVHA